LSSFAKDCIIVLSFEEATIEIQIFNNIFGGGM
jgi:hypothetical protein